MLDELGNESVEQFWETAFDYFKHSSGTVENDEYVSYHLYYVILWLWDSGTVTEPKVHALLTYILERNILQIFSDPHLETIS